MKLSYKTLALSAVVAAGLLATTAGTATAAATSSAADGSRQARPSGAVYTLTNSPTGNAVVVYDRFADGTLVQQGSYPTGGNGTGAGLGSQGALALAGDELFAVNAASNSISGFRVLGHGLALEATVPSNGVRPISLSVHDHTVYVLNAGGTGNITAFDSSHHGLTAIPDSTQPLGAGSAGPAQVSFSPDGRNLVVTEKASSTIDVYHVDRHGVAGAPVAHPATGGTPFGFDFDRRGNILTSNASGSASSYAMGRNDTLSVISGAIATGQAAPCWLVTSANGRYAYTANAGAGTISGFTVGRDGTLTLLNADGVTASFGAGSHPLDETVSTDGRFLFNLTDGLHSITSLRIAADGNLTIVGTTTGLPAGTIGIVAS